MKENSIDIERMLKKLYQRNDWKRIVCIDKATMLEMRINKHVYKTKKNSLEIEIRFSQNTRIFFDKIIQVFTNQNVDYRIKRTPKMELPSRIYSNFRNSGIYSIPTITNIIDKILLEISAVNHYQLFMDHREMYQWSNAPIIEKNN